MITLKQICTEPEKHIVFENRCQYFPDLPKISGCNCTEELKVKPQTLRTNILGFLRTQLMTQTTEVMITVIGSDKFFDVLQIIATARTLGITELSLNLFEKKLMTDGEDLIKRLYVLVQYLRSQNVRVNFPETHANPEIRKNILTGLTKAEQTSVEMTVNIRCFGKTNSDLELRYYQSLPTNIIFGIDFSEAAINPFRAIQGILRVARPGTQLMIGNKNYEAENPHVLAWLRTKTIGGNWASHPEERKLSERALSTPNIAGFYSRAITGCGPNSGQLKNNPIGPYADRYRTEADSSSLLLWTAKTKIILPDGRIAALV